MKLFLPLLGLMAIMSCKPSDKKAEPAAETPAELPLLDRLAQAHGYDHWKGVSEIRFTFNVDRDTTHYERSWIWDVRSQRVTRIAQGDTVSYLRSEVDSTLAQVDGGFINDKYWMLAPFQWVWDRESFTHTYEEGVAAPLSGKTSNKLTIVYQGDGGYTPGDAYDFFLDENDRVFEWNFRRGNQPEPSLTSTWEDYKDFGGLQIATMHQNADGSFKLYFTGIEVN